ncbi:MAG: glycoside hydrolase family 78 protein [Bacteroidales bacterium]|nr:glycoside hydrolase family 78 protein [Bacteroidales bacterium]
MKLRYLLILKAVILLLIYGCSDSVKTITFYDLRCENLTEPPGTGTDAPRLSWKIRSAGNGTRQTAYQLLVATGPGLLNEEDANLWNSGKVISPESVLVPYNGKRLSSRSSGYWKVRIWNEGDVVSEWSDQASFSIGLLNGSDWIADYIGFPDREGRSPAPQLRKTFEMPDEPEKVFLHVNSLGYHEVYLNGEKVSDYVLTPAVSQFNKRSVANTYDITPLLKAGRNDIVLWIGQGWYSKGLPGVADEGPLVRAQIEQYSNGAWKTVHSTDPTWKARNSGYYNTGTWRPGRFGGELVDGSLLLPDLSGETLDKAVWEPVITVMPPDHEVSPQVTENNRIIEEIKPVSIQPEGENTWLIDMGTSVTGWIDVKFSQLNSGDEIILEYSDRLDKSGKFANQNQRDGYIASGKDNEFFRNKFNYHSFRYLKISNLRQEPAREDIAAFLIHTNYRMASSFECSDPDLNMIHDMVLHTLKCLSLGGYLVDCSHIERLGYGGDGNASTQTAQIMFDMAPLYNNWLQAWADCIREDGGMPHTAPNPYRAGGGPYWCGFLITASWKTYLNYGDTRLLEKYYPVMQQWLGYVEKHSPEGLLEPWPETDYRSWYLGDWATPEGVDQTDPASVSLVNNCFITICYETMEKIAEAIGKTDDIRIFAERKEQLRRLINEKLFNTTKRIYGSGSQIDLTYPLLAGIVPETLKEAVRINLIDEIKISHNGHFACGLVGVPVFTEWAAKEHESDLMYSMLKKRAYPGYLYMIDNGATATWEHWDGSRSRIHNCYNGIGSWFYEAVGGIRADENSPAWKRLVIDPQIPAGITWANTTKETPYGTVTVNWSMEKEILEISVKIPVGCTASLTIPENTKSFRLNGRNVKTGDPCLKLESGEYFLRFRH